jgi:hypothetical protein
MTMNASERCSAAARAFSHSAALAGIRKPNGFVLRLRTCTPIMLNTQNDERERRRVREVELAALITEMLDLKAGAILADSE